jgi:hypothetical protein
VPAFLRSALALALAPAAIAQIAILQIKVVEGEGSVHIAGARATRPLTVEVTGETGRPVEGAAVTFHLPDEGPGGVFASGLRTETATTDGRGRASLRGMRWNRTPGPFQIRMTVSKDGARAGMVSSQYLTDAAVRTGLKARGPRKKLALILLVAAAAAGGGVAAGMGGGAKTVAPQAGTPQAPAVTVGSPVIMVGRP